MKRLSRRSFLAGSAALAVEPCIRAAAASAEVDVVIVGAGAAGIAAGRRLASAGRRIAIFEAADRVGGRCVTDSRIFGVPYDMGAHWIHRADVNPLARLAPRSGFDVYPAPPGQKLRIGRRNAREGEMEEFLAATVRVKRAIADAARGKTDISCAQAIPKDLGDWQASVEFFLGAFGCGKDMADVSAADFSKSAEHDADAFCRQGFGALLAGLAGGLPIERSTPVREIEMTRSGPEVVTASGRTAARAVIVTASTNLLASGAIKFTPDLPKRQTDALAALKLGTYERIALELPDNPLKLQSDDLVFEKARGRETAALLANVSDTNVCFVDVGGRFAEELSARGREAMASFALDWLGGLYGTDLKKAVRRSHVTRWREEPWVLGSFSAAAPGGTPSRRVLMEPLRERIFFAGEAVHETLWGTVGGAWESGERAADAVLKMLLPPPAPARVTKKRRG
ncbi:MAG TPA: NAD(P)/FAD-dependent oxidoreductase [Pseudorhodoplanes sp.]|nr:NAD(P)/FAD-dependent oxidoreductase [Pseudorhodoplanes sp.]